MCNLAIVSSQTIINENHISQLQNIHQRSVNLQNKNLNRFAMETLYEYDKVYDSLAALERSDTLLKINQLYAKANSSNQMLSDSLDSKLKFLASKKDSLRHKYFGLLKKSLAALIVWLTIIGVILYIRTRAMRKFKILEAESTIALSSYQTLSQSGESLLGISQKINPLNSSIANMHSSLSTFNNSLREQLKSGQLSSDQYKDFQLKTAEILGLVNNQHNIIRALQIQEGKDEDEKTEADINNLCLSYLDLAHYGLTDDSFKCKVSTDLENRLPKIKVHSKALGTLLGNILVNAFQAVKEKSILQEKGYQPSIVVSTRILPRFLQIRIKDNGIGIPDSELENIFTPFSTMNDSDKGAGLGLSEANRIMKELHNGEIIVESDISKGTDVYLKFYTINGKV